MNLDKRVFTMMMALLMAVFVPKAWAQDVWDGKTMEEVIPDEGGIYHIKTGAQLAWVADQYSDIFQDKTIQLDNDIDLGNKQWDFPYSYMEGNIDGQGHTIKGLYVNIDLPEITGEHKPDISFGLFRSISGTVKQLCVIGEVNVSTVNQRIFGGAIAGSNHGTITECYTNVTMNIKTNSSCIVGGIIGDSSGTISDCYTIGNIAVKNGDCSVGGISGIARENSSISGCYTTGAVIGENNSGDISGIIGSDYSNNNPNNCIALNSEIKGSDYSTNRIAGTYGTPLNCHASKTLSGWEDSPQNGVILSTEIDLKDIFTTEGAWTFSDESFPTLTVFGTSQPTPPLIADHAKEPSSVTNELQSSTSVWTIPGNLCIRTDSPAEIRIYTFYGRQIESISAHSGEITLTLPSDNYVVVVDGHSYKVQVRQ